MVVSYVFFGLLGEFPFKDEAKFRKKQATKSFKKKIVNLLRVILLNKWQLVLFLWQK